MANDFEWIIKPIDNEPTSPVFDFLRKAADALAMQTGGKVLGTVAESGHPFGETLSVIAEISRGLYPPRLFSSSKDADDIYEKTNYYFIIYDKAHSYELPAFSMKCNDLMPISVSIDSTIAQEEGLQEKCEVSSFSAFQSLFRHIMQSKKVIYIISHLAQLPDVPEAISDTTTEDETENEPTE